jgi:hypothetical protein
MPAAAVVAGQKNDGKKEGGPYKIKDKYPVKERH